MSLDPFTMPAKERENLRARTLKDLRRLNLLRKEAKGKCDFSDAMWYGEKIAQSNRLLSQIAQADTEQAVSRPTLSVITGGLE